MSLGPWHFSWTVTNLERSVAFYTGALDFEVMHAQVNRNPYTDRLVGIPGIHLKAAMLKIRGAPAGAHPVTFLS